ncbi:hypothetical protein EJ03DRAFT_79526 [Teratosphaeria nubilosa]|uniref:non-specific serine/threonine protein kinase n=1 Tax=Teratosphaeria nubilosa TaxID=161662 RepID=A0A6G1LCD4_9PEZI|nr:hypothetical protein EJ03DRAFT_79526 [Teratosphaeria nubilosa]
MEDIVLDVEASDIDCLYRIARRTSSARRVMYVTICDASIIPAEERTESGSILKNLRKLAGWTDETWHTMIASRTTTGIRTELDHTAPHALSNEILLPQVPRYDIFDVEILAWSKHRTPRARIGGQDVFMKIAPFSYQLPYLQQEVKMYQYLLGEEFPMAPELLGYVYEETADRIIGFLCEGVKGRHPLAGDLNSCINALERLHAKGVYHGDINKYNMLITPANEVVFIDFEDSAITATSEWSDTEMAGLMQAEEHGLSDCLSDQSNRGRPLDMSG